MTHCAKCGTELIGSKKFCSTCGAPAGDPRSPVASTGATPVAAGSSGANVAPAPGSSQENVYSSSSSGPVSQVNPFAQTAGPAVRASDYGPPPTSLPPELASTAPGLGASARPSQLSPLASSNVNSERGAFATAGGSAVAQAAQQAIEQASARAATPSGAPSGPTPEPAAIKKIPGTQIMPSMQNPPVGAGAAQGQAAAPPPPPQPKKQQGTFVMPVPKPPGSQPSSQPSFPVAQPSVQPSQQPQPAHSQQPQPAHSQQPVPPYVQQPPPQQQPPQQQWGQPQNPYQQPPPQQQQAPVSAYASPYAVAAATGVPAAPPPGAYQYGFGYNPGSRVTVTWSNGHRYPGTVQQVSGAQCLVLFPDGQQHWVEMQYVAPA